MRKFILLLPKIVGSILFTLVLLELGLRLLPGVIPLNFLIHFDEALRTEVARRRGLPVVADTIVLERDDGGPELRVFKPFTTITQTVKDYDTVVTVELDENGFCNPPQPTGNRQTVDIVALGDSFTFCHNVQPEEAWTGRLAALTGYSTYNLGRVKVGIHSHLQILKNFGLQKSPEVVIMNVYEGNDLRDARKYFRYKRDKPEHEPAAPAAAPRRDAALLDGNLFGRYSYAFNLLRSFSEYWQTPEATGPEEIAELPASDDLQTTDFRYQLIFPGEVVISFNPLNTDKDEVRFARRMYAREIDIGVSWVIAEALEEFVELSREYGFTPVVTYTPSAHTAYAENVQFNDPSLQELMPWFSQEQRTFLAEMEQQLGFIFIDLTPAIQSAARSYGSEELLYYRYDLHLTAAGHAVVARALSQKLQELSVVRKRRNPDKSTR